MQRLGYFRGLVRLRKKPAAIWDVLLPDFASAGRQNKLDRRPASPNGVRELHAIHGARHLYIGKYDSNIRSAFQDTQSVVCALGLNRFKARVLDNDGRHHQEDNVIFNDEHDGFGGTAKGMNHMVRPRFQ